MKLYIENNVVFAIGAAINVIDAIDNFEFFAWGMDSDSGQFRTNNENWLLATELSRQISQASQPESADVNELVRLRIENRQFVIPPAIQ